MNADHPIGLYDSGVGGLSVLYKLHLAFPQRRFLYFADCAHFPYGNKSQEEIIDYSRNIIAWMCSTEQSVQFIVSACHTSSAIALPRLDKTDREIKVPVFGMIASMVEHIARSSWRKVAIIATPASKLSAMHEKLLLAHGFKGEVTTVACDDFATLIESSVPDKSVPDKSVADKELDKKRDKEQDEELDKDKGQLLNEKARLYMSEVNRFGADVLIYGCTHYIFIQQIIKQHLYNEEIVHIDPSEYLINDIAQQLQLRRIKQPEQLNQLNQLQQKRTNQLKQVKQIGQLQLNSLYGSHLLHGITAANTWQQVIANTRFVVSDYQTAFANKVAKITGIKPTVHKW